MTAMKCLYTSGGKKPKVSGKKKARNVTLSLETLQKVKKSSRTQHGRPKRTRDNYAGYVQSGKTFLEDLVAERWANVDSGHSTSDDDNVDVDLLEKAFDNPPNKYSVMALKLFLVQKCLTEDWGSSTAAGIQGGFADYWDNMWVPDSFQFPVIKERMVVVHCRDGDTFAGLYSFDKETETVKGCPARSSIIRSYIKVIDSKSGAKGVAAAIWHHAEAMKIEELKKIIQWLEIIHPKWGQ
jgi:hypothetical protein